MKVNFNLEPEDLIVPEGSIELLNTVTETVSKLYGLENAEVGITLTNNEYIHQINRQYRNIDRPTDVISFALNDISEEEPIILDNGELQDKELLGDIIISVEQAAKQSEDYGHSLTREISFLTVHGLLHLLGYDHIDPSDEVEMQAEQKIIMEQLQITR